MSYKHVKEWRNRTKERLCSIFKNKCCICGYSKCIQALEFHHKDPREKDFSLSAYMPMEWGKLVKEVLKCVCLCANCHREVHYNITKIPEVLDLDYSKIDDYDPSIGNKLDVSAVDFNSLNENISISQLARENNLLPSSLCRIAKEKGYKSKYTSKKFEVSKNELEILIKEKPLTEIAKIYGVSDNAIKKRAIKLGIKIPKFGRGYWSRKS